MAECNHDCKNCASAGTCSQKIEKINVLDDSSVKRVVAVTSGKGGVGKSMVTSLLAVGLAREGYKVGIIDADITGPSIPKMFDLEGRLYGDDKGMYPATTTKGIKVVSVNLLLENVDDPILWRGALINSLLRQFYEQVHWGELDFLLIDMPPGTGDVALTTYQQIPVDDLIIVSCPQDLVSLIVSKSIKMAEMMNINTLGLVENMSYLVCPHCGEHLEIFNTSHIDEIAEKFNLEVLDRIPLDRKLAELADEGLIEANHVNYIDNLVKKVANSH